MSANPDPPRTHSLPVRVIVGLLTATALTLSVAAPAEAAPRTINDSQVAQLTTTPNRTQVSAGLKAHEVAGDSLVIDNTATATSECNNCHTTAISFQVVVGRFGASEIRANNAATAINRNCANCTATALAYQFVVVDDNLVLLSPTAMRRLQQINVELRLLSLSNPTPDQAKALADGYAAEVASLLQNELKVYPQVRKAQQLQRG